MTPRATHSAGPCRSRERARAEGCRKSRSNKSEEVLHASPDLRHTYPGGENGRKGVVVALACVSVRAEISCMQVWKRIRGFTEGAGEKRLSQV